MHELYNKCQETNQGCEQTILTCQFVHRCSDFTLELTVDNSYESSQKTNAGYEL